MYFVHIYLSQPQEDGSLPTRQRKRIGHPWKLELLRSEERDRAYGTGCYVGEELEGRDRAQKPVVI